MSASSPVIVLLAAGEASRFGSLKQLAMIEGEPMVRRASRQALACGVPVLGTASGGITEVVEHGVTGYLTEVGDIDAMAAYAIEMLRDEEKARAMGAAGRARAERMFSRDDIVAQYEALYEEVLHCRSGKQPLRG